MKALVRVLVVILVGILAAGCAVDGPPVPPQRDGRVLWQSDLATGDLTRFKELPPESAGAKQPTVVTTPTRSDAHAVAFTIPGPAPAGAVARTEVVPKFRDIEVGDDLYFGFSTYLEPGFPTDVHWQSLVQFTQNVDGAPPLGLYVEDGSYRIEGGYGYPGGAQPFNKAIHSIVVGKWVDWVIHVVFSPDPKVGYVEVWADGIQVQDRYTPPWGTLYPSSGPTTGYVAFGYARRPDIPPPGSVVFDDLRIGTTESAVRHIDTTG